MYEAQKHINDRLSQFDSQESAFYRVVAKHSNLPQLIKGFEEIPEKLKQD